MLKKMVAVVAIVSLTLTPISQVNAAVKAGSTCPKAGNTAIASGKTFTCIQSGKKLVWDKGKENKSSNSNGLSPSSTTPVTNAEDDSVVISQGITYRYINGELERMASKSGKFYKLDSRKQSDFDPIRVKAYAEIRSRVTNASHPNLTFNWDIKPSFPSEIAQFSKDLVEVAASFWGWIFKMPVNVPAQLVTEQDLAWEKMQEVKFSDTLDILNLFTTDGFKNQRPWMGGGAHLWYRNPTESNLTSLLNFQAPSYATTGNIAATWVMVPTHEVTHLIQDYFRLGIFDIETKSFDQRANGTFQEGTATLFGYALSMKNLGWYSDGIDEYLYANFKYDKYWKPIKTVDDVINLLVETEARTNNSTHQSSYPVGAMLYEWVIANYGFDAYIKILENLPKYPDFSDNIKASIGITKAQLYKDAAPYILTAFKRVNLN
jgi:hypothetical protein